MKGMHAVVNYAIHNYAIIDFVLYMYINIIATLIYTLSQQVPYSAQRCVYTRFFCFHASIDNIRGYRRQIISLNEKMPHRAQQMFYTTLINQIN